MIGMAANSVKPVGEHNFHFTLIFLGEISEEQARQAGERLGRVRFEPFSITYTGVGGFPDAGRARVVWIGVDPAGREKLSALAARVVAEMSEIGFAPDKPFSPHLTILRAKKPVRIDAARYAGRTFGTDIIDKLHLKKSDLAPSGPTYSNVYTVAAAKEWRE
jgi:2'-5' RNA ligase